VQQKGGNMMSKLDRVIKAIELMKARKIPSKIVMSKQYAIALKKEMMPVINQHFINGEMTVRGIPWELNENIRGFKVE
jgi:hypothetical protein